MCAGAVGGLACTEGKCRVLAAGQVPYPCRGKPTGGQGRAQQEAAWLHCHLLEPASVPRNSLMW